MQVAWDIIWPWGVLSPASLEKGGAQTLPDLLYIALRMGKRLWVPPVANYRESSENMGSLFRNLALPGSSPLAKGEAGRGYALKDAGTRNDLRPTLAGAIFHPSDRAAMAAES